MARIEKRSPTSHQAEKRAKQNDKPTEKKDRKPERPVAVRGTWQHDFAADDKNHDGQLAKSEMGFSKAERKAFDLNNNHMISKKEYSAAFRKANSFEGLDHDDDGGLDKAEMKRMSRHTQASYDGDGDGKVSASEFVEARRTERKAINTTRRDAAYDALTSKEKKALKRYDTDESGAISREEYHAGRHQDWKKAVDAKIDTNFKQAAGKGDDLKAEDGSLYKSYDKDQDGRVSRTEFRDGQLADRKATGDQNIAAGAASRMLLKRLRLEHQGGGLSRIDQAGPSGSTANGPTDLTVSSFNILGSFHTAPGGSKAGYASGAERARWAAQYVKSKKLDVVGFQEMEPDQARAFQKEAGDQYGLFPGNSRGDRASLCSVAWHKDKWDMVKAETISVPFIKGVRRERPVVLLRNKETGQEVYFANFHNAPKWKKGPSMQEHRDRATDIQVALVNRLRRETGLPVVITGDMNERDNYYRRMTREGHMTAANAGKNGARPKHMGIDWIFGSKGVKFKRYMRNHDGILRKTTDHGVITTKARIKP